MRESRSLSAWAWTSPRRKIIEETDFNSGLFGQISVACFNSVATLAGSFCVAATRALLMCIPATVRAVSIAAVAFEASKSFAVTLNFATRIRPVRNP